MFLRLVQELNMMEEFKEVVRGFTDTLPLFKNKMTERKSNKQSFSQSVLAEDLLDPQAAVGAHDARVDVMILEQLVNHEAIGVSELELIDNAVTINYIVNREHKVFQSKIIRNSLEVFRVQKDVNGRGCK